MAQTIHWRWRFGVRSGSATITRPRRWLCMGLSLVLVYWLCIRPKRYTEVFELRLEDPSTRTSALAVDSKHLWEFIADFSNHPKLNPTITRFEILYEKGNYENWEYGVAYEQDSLLLPRWVHYQNHAVFKILPEVKESFKHINAGTKPKPKPGNPPPSFNLHEPAKILSNQTTCWLGYCVESASEMRFITIHTANPPLPAAIAAAAADERAGMALVHVHDTKPLTIAGSKSTRILETLRFQCPPVLAYLFATDLFEHKKLVFENIENSLDDLFM